MGKIDIDLLNAATQIQGLVMTLWTVFVAIVAATLALITSERKMLQRPQVRLLIIAGYVVAACVNLFAMLNLRSQHDILVHLMSTQGSVPAGAAQISDLQTYMLRPGRWLYISAHLGIGLGVCLAVWLLPQKVD
jgi:hypothetical protein